MIYLQWAVTFSRQSPAVSWLTLPTWPHTSPHSHTHWLPKQPLGENGQQLAKWEAGNRRELNAIASLCRCPSCILSPTTARHLRSGIICGDLKRWPTARAVSSIWPWLGHCLRRDTMWSDSNRLPDQWHNLKGGRNRMYFKLLRKRKCLNLINIRKGL